MTVLIYLLLLPLFVWLLGSVLNLLDHEDRAATLRRIVWRSLPLLAFAVLLGSRVAAPMAAALVTVALLHVGWFLGTRLIIRRGWLSEPGED
ncbi:MAG: hypothetical protein ACNA7W_22045 [Pseudomonadales bacterium]